ncbi:hypothetical protein KA977_15660, partial [Candidatus Dependentiae bacterium]|nr:hypothetical protein [Candidatus Dependentiae bacterium]
MTLISSELKYIEVPLREIIEIIEKHGSVELGHIRLATDISENGKTYSVKGSEISSPSVQKKFI